MAYYSNHNLAYDFTLFEEPVNTSTTARRGKKNEEKSAAEEGGKKVNQTSGEKRSAAKTKVKREHRRKSNFARIALGVIAGLAIVFVVVSIIHAQVQLTELNQEIVNARAELAEKQSVYTQLEMKVDSSISAAAVEEYARDQLNMTKAANSQKEFITLSEGDKAEVTLSPNKNIFERIADAIASLWS